MMPQETLNECELLDLGLIDYDKAYSLQKTLVQEVINGQRPKLILCEHPPILTLGRLADRSNLLLREEDIRAKGVMISDIDRGGEVTLHSPGQLVAYPILDLKNYQKDLKNYLTSLEDVIVDFLGNFGIVGRRFPGQTGVWVKDQKIASLGIGVSKWVCFHGLAINVNTHLEYFKLIKPCGLDVEMTSMKKITGQEISMKEAKDQLVFCFSKKFQLDILEGAHRG